MKKITPLLGAALVLGPLAGQASAHVAVVECGPTPTTPLVRSTDPVRYPLVGATIAPDGVTPDWKDGYRDPRAPYPLPVGCEYPPPPVPPVPPVPPATTPPIVVVPPPVVELPPIKRNPCTPLLRAVYRNGAGMKWVKLARAFGCVPQRPTCAWLKKRGAGPRTYAKLGYYPGCKPPRPVPNPRPPVTW